jgi:hypothetical protein
MTIQKNREEAPTRARAEQPVFAATDGRRARRLRRAAAVVAGLACVWLVGLALGTGGFDGLPRVSVPGLDRIGVQREQQGERPRPAVRRAPAAVVDLTRSRSTPSARAGARPANSRSSRARTTPNRPANRRPVPRPPQPVTPQPVPPPPVPQGWTRHGVTVPPGQARKAQPPPPPAPPGNGRRVGQQPTPPPPPGKHAPKG